MNIKINYPENKVHIYNLAFIKAYLIKKAIESLDIDIKEKKIIKNNILEYLKAN